MIVLVGGTATVYEESRPILDTFAKKTFHIGPCGAGMRMKLVTNLVLGLHRAVLAEGLTFARAIGLDPANSLEILKASVAYSRTMDTKGHKMVEADFSVEARLSQHLKDVRLILSHGSTVDATLPLSEVHRQLLELAEAAGYGDADNSAILRAFGES